MCVGKPAGKKKKAWNKKRVSGLQQMEYGSSTEEKKGEQAQESSIADVFFVILFLICSLLRKEGGNIFGEQWGNEK